MIVRLAILFIGIVVLMIIMIIPLAALPSPLLYNMISLEPNISLVNGPVVVYASQSEEQKRLRDGYGIDGQIGFNSSGIIEQGSNDSIYPAFNYSLEIKPVENEDLTRNSSFLPIPNLASETRQQSVEEASISQDASKMTQNAIEKMVNPSSLLSSAIDDIFDSGVVNDSEISQEVQSVPSSKTLRFLNTEFSTIPLYGMNIPPKDYLVVSGDESSSNESAKVFATARIPCNDKNETPLKVVLLENWSRIVYPPPKMHLIDADKERQLCMFRVEYPEKGFVDSYVTLTPNDWDSTRDIASSKAIALYNSGASAIKFPAASSITVSRVNSL